MSISTRTPGIFFDSRCLLHQCNYDHAEGPRRAVRSYEYLINTGLLQQCKLLQVEGCSILDTIIPMVNTDTELLNCIDAGSKPDNILDGTDFTKSLYGTMIPLQYDPTITPTLVQTMNQTLNPFRTHPDGEPSDKKNNNQTDPDPNSFAVHPNFKKHITPIIVNSLEYRQEQSLFPTPRRLIPNNILERVHNINLIGLIDATRDLDYGDDELDSETEGDDTLYPDCKFLTSDTYVNRYTSTAARIAVTGCIELARAVCEGIVPSAVAIVRPPGHHAGLPLGTPIDLKTSPDTASLVYADNNNNINNHNDNNNNNNNNDNNNNNNNNDNNNNDNDSTNIHCAPTCHQFDPQVIQDVIEYNNNENENFSKEIGVKGFCIYNNIALAAQTTLLEYPDIIKKVAIIDFDIHHGNGTQAIFTERDNVLFFSIHRFAESFFPESGWWDETGTGRGVGYSVNIPMENTYVRNIDFLIAFVLVIFPILESFSPDMVFVSAGMDFLRGDPIGKMEYLTPDVIYHIIYALSRLSFNTYNQTSSPLPPPSRPQLNRLVIALEGGYNDTVVADGICTIVQSLIDSAAVQKNPQSSQTHQPFPTTFPLLFDPLPTQPIERLDRTLNVDRFAVSDNDNDENSDNDLNPSIHTKHIHQFYSTLYSVIQNLYQFWPVLIDDNTFFNLIYPPHTSTPHQGTLGYESLLKIWSDFLAAKNIF